MADLRDAGGGVGFIEADLTDPDACGEAVRHVIHDGGRSMR